MSKRSHRKNVTGVVAIDEMLLRNPHAAVESKDNAKCMLFFELLGILQCFRRGKEPSLSAIVYQEHATHWIVGMLWSGYEKPEENGYRLICLPKAQISEQEAHELARSVMKACIGHHYEEGTLNVPTPWTLRN